MKTTRDIIKRLLKESHVDGKGKNYIKDVDKSGKDDNDLCDELTINSVKELRRKMRGMDISKKDKVKINNYIKEMNKTNKKLSADLDVNNTYLRYIQNMLCTYSSEDKNNIDEMKVTRLNDSHILRIVKRVLKEDDKEQEVEDIVHRKMDEFATDTMSEFIDIVGEIEDELQKKNINDDGFLYKTQLIFFEELVDLVDHCIEEIKHGIHHHHEMEHLQHHKKDGNNTHH